MVVSRWKARKTLRSIMLCMDGFDEFIAKSQRLKDCVDGGLVVSSRDPAFMI